MQTGPARGAVEPSDASSAESSGGGADRVLTAIRLLADHARPIRLEELARELAAPKSTTHRILVTLRRAGFAEQDEEGRYALSLEFLRMAFRHYQSLDERNLVQGTLEMLVSRFGETTYYAKLDGAEVVYFAMVSMPGFVHTAALVGARQPAYRTALGKALLSRVLADRAAVDRFVERHGPLVGATPNSITNAAGLHRALRETRARGYAIDDEENEAGVVCIAYPVYLGPASEPSGAISVAAIKHRTSLEDLVRRAPEAAGVIERMLGTEALQHGPGAATG